MTRPTPRADLVKAVSEALGIVFEAIGPEHTTSRGDAHQELLTLRAAALPVILRELLDVEVTQ